MRKKVIYIVHDLKVGGVETALLSGLILLNQKFDFKLLCLGTVDPDFTEGLPDSVKNNIVLLPFKGLGYLTNLLRVVKYVRKKNPDILITSLWKSAVSGTIIKKIFPRISYIHFIHNNKFFHWPDKIFGIWAMKNATAIFCDSNASNKFVKEIGITKETIVISFLRFTSPDHFEQRKMLGYKALYLGRFHKQKRIDRLITLIKSLRDNGLPFTLDLYGRADGVGDLIQQAIKDHRMEKYICIKEEIKPNKVQDIFKLYDYYFQTSENEGMAMSVAEAMQMGLVCVCTNVGEIENYAQHFKNAIIIKQPYEEGVLNTIQAIAQVSENRELYNQLSFNAYMTFKGRKVFADSFVGNIEKVVSSDV